MARNDQTLYKIRKVYDSLLPYNGQVLGFEQIRKLGGFAPTLLKHGWAVKIPYYVRGGQQCYQYLIQFPSDFDIEEYLKQWKENWRKRNRETTVWWERSKAIWDKKHGRINKCKEWENRRVYQQG